MKFLNKSYSLVRKAGVNYIYFGCDKECRLIRTYIIPTPKVKQKRNNLKQYK